MRIFLFSNHHLDVQKHIHSHNSPWAHATTQEYKNTQYRHGKESKKIYLYEINNTEQNKTHTYTNKNKTKLANNQT